MIILDIDTHTQIHTSYYFSIQDFAIVIFICRTPGVPAWQPGGQCSIPTTRPLHRRTAAQERR